MSENGFSPAFKHWKEQQQTPGRKGKDGGRAGGKPEVVYKLSLRICLAGKESPWIPRDLFRR